MKRHAEDGDVRPPAGPEKLFKVPKRKQPKPVVRTAHGFRAEPLSPITPLTAREKLRRGIHRARLQLYKHSAIPDGHIRLLVVNPGESPEDIFVSLKTVPIRDLGCKYEYEALSYHWGSGDANNPIYVRDVQDLGAVGSMDEAVLLGMKRLYVKPNLNRALHNLRQKDTSVILWVDAICINQEDEEEKKVQVAKMAQIYSMAERVCIWLGAGDERSDNAIKFISDIIDLEGLHNLTRDERYTSRWDDLIYLMRSSWFSRRWVIQEIALARDATVHCGKAEIHWSDFKDAISLFVIHFDTIRELFKRSKEFAHNYFAIGELDPLGAKVLVDITSNIFRKDADGTNFEPIKGLEYLVSTLSTFEASDPRDTVYALRNVSNEIPWTVSSGEDPADSKQPPKPDYKKDLLEVYIEFVRWVIETSGFIDIICRHWALPEKAEKTYNYPALVELPSWIQEISESPYGRQEEGFNGRKNGDSFVGLPGHRWYNASHGMHVPGARFGDYQQQIATSTTRGPTQVTASTPIFEAVPKKVRDPSLFVQGLHIETVTWASNPTADGVILNVCLQRGDWSGHRATQIDKAPDKLWRTLVADRGPDGKNPPSWYHRACLHCLVNDTTNGHINTRELLGKGQPDIVRDYLKRVQAVTWNRVFLEADSQAAGAGAEKLFGLGPPRTEPGDLICVLFGCSVPCVLRRHPHVDGAFEFIGEAYIYGRMDGEAVTMLSEEDLRLQTREFRLL